MTPVALITGASRGIGRGIALQLAQLGHSLVINYAGNADAARQTQLDCEAAAASSIPHSALGTPKFVTCQADISLGADRERLVAFTRETFGRLDLLVNNAGVAPTVRTDLLEASEASFDRLININLKGPFFLTQLVSRWMIQQKETAGADYLPKIVIISSVSAYAPSTARGEYCVSKAGVAMMTQLYASRLAEHGINVYEIRPGVIATDMTGPVKQKYDALIAGGLTPIKRWGQPDDIARAVSAIAQNLLPFSTGEVINVDGGFHLRRL